MHVTKTAWRCCIALEHQVERPSLERPSLAASPYCLIASGRDGLGAPQILDSLVSMGDPDARASVSPAG